MKRKPGGVRTHLSPDLRDTSRMRAFERLRETVLSARRMINQALDTFLDGIEEYERAIAADPIANVATIGPDRTGGYELAVEITGMGISTIRKLMRTQGLPFRRVPSPEGSRPSIRFSERSLREWMAAREVRSQARHDAPSDRP